MGEFQFANDLTVRFAETDAQGVAHHASYFVWFEVTRIEYLRRFRGGYAVSALLYLGRAHAALGRTDESLRCFDEAEAASAAITTRPRLDVLLESAEARKAAGRAEEAAERVRLACAWWDEIAETRRQSGGDVAEAERQRDALAAEWEL